MKIDLVITDMWPAGHEPRRMTRDHRSPVSVLSEIPADIARPEGHCVVQISASTPDVTLTATGAGQDLYDAAGKEEAGARL